MLHIEMMKAKQWKGLCNEALYSNEMNSISSGIRTWNLVIRSKMPYLFRQLDISNDNWHQQLPYLL